MIGNYKVTNESIQNIYENGLLTRPTSMHSMYKAAEGGFITGSKFVGDIYNKVTGAPENTHLKETLEVIKRETSFEGQTFGEKSKSWIADIVGFSLNPIVLGLGAAGGIAARGIGAIGRAVAPKAVIPFIERPVYTKTVGGVEKSVTVGEIGERLTAGTLMGEFTGIPIAFEEGSASAAHIMGGIGFAISSVPVLFGLRRALGKSIEKPKLEAEVAPTPKEMSETEKWEHDYVNNLDTIPNLQERATKILKENGFEVDQINHKVDFTLLNENDIKNLQVAVTDSMVSDVSPGSKNHLIDYIINNRVDEIRSNPKSKAMLEAYDNFITGKLTRKEEMISFSDAAHIKNMSKSLPQKSFLSQGEIYKHLKKLSFEESHESQLPFIMPDNVSKRIKMERRIAELKKKEPNKQVQRRIKELEDKLPEIKTPKKELEEIYSKMIVGKEYMHPMKSKAYQRLIQLADHWPQAKSLLERVNLEEAFAKQEAIRDSLAKLKKAVDYPSGRTANPQNVIAYLQERIEGMRKAKNPIGIKEKTPEQKIQESSTVPSDVSKVIDEQQEFVDEISEKAPELRNEYSKINNKIRQFNKSEKTLQEYIQCVLGAR